MKTNKITYWVLTSLVAAGFGYSSYLYLSQDPGLMSAFKFLGYPMYFVSMLGIAKLLGAIALINPWFKGLKKLAYAGFLFTLIGAIWTHVATHSPVTMPVVYLLLLSGSYFFYLRVYEGFSVPTRRMALQ